MHLEDIEFLNALRTLPPEHNRIVVRHCAKTCAHAIGECVFNLMLNGKGLKKRQKKKVEKELLPYYGDLLTLASAEASLWNKKKSLFNLSGQALKTILESAQPRLRVLEKIKRKELRNKEGDVKERRRRRRKREQEEEEGKDSVEEIEQNEEAKNKEEEEDGKRKRWRRGPRKGKQQQ